MLSELTGTTGLMVRLALDAANLRHLVLANNIANANTPEFTPLRVTFEEHLAAAARALRGDAAADRARLAAVRPTLTADIGAPVDARVAVDQELVKLNQNAIHYQALLRGLQGRVDMLQLAINDGRR